ncbi:hypothetical protein BU15DRAFT_89001 [Melanogaster broomeanus]|nr:hypothetical protein BU15DRAFT_89001 [Melanogaster broomeanus]
MDTVPGSDSTHLTWGNVGLGFSFILLNAFLSTSLNLGVGHSLVSSAVRCVVQLSIVGLLLQRVFETNNPWAVAGIAFANKSKKRFNNMFSSVLMSMLGSTIPVSIIGARHIWKPEQYIPIVGMLCGNTISGMVVVVAYVLKEMYDNRDKVEMYLAFGASRFEACLPIAREALRLALTPTINQMSVIGIIAIPGMMTGAILGGASVDQAAKLQMVIMFMISASTGIAAIAITVITLGVVVGRGAPSRDWVFAKIVGTVKSTWTTAAGCCCKRQKEGRAANGGGTGERLLG